MSTVRFVELERDLVAVGGPDRRTFLQGLISQDVERLSAARAAYGAFLTPQGKYLHDFCLADMGDRLILDGEIGRGEELISRLRRYRLRAQVELTVADELAVRAVFGSGAPAAVGLPGERGAARPLGGGVAFVDPRSAELGCRLILPRATAAKAVGELPVEPGQFADYDRLRIRLGVPDGTRDMEVEKSTLLECNFDMIDGVDWDKGCYVGQEVTARTKYRGLVKRQLVPVAVEGDHPQPGTAISLGERRVGEIRSGCNGVALASLQLDALSGDNAPATFTAGKAVIRPLGTSSTS